MGRKTHPGRKRVKAHLRQVQIARDATFPCPTCGAEMATSEYAICISCKHWPAR